MMNGKKKREKKEILKEGRVHPVEIGSQPPRVAIPRKITQQYPPTDPLYKPPLPSPLKTERQECQFFPTNDIMYIGLIEGIETFVSKDIYWSRVICGVKMEGEGEFYCKRKWTCFCGKVVWVKEREK